MTDELVDAAGFPRNDIDVYQVRHARNKIICRFYFSSFMQLSEFLIKNCNFIFTFSLILGLQNDHKAIMLKVEEGLHKLHKVAGAITEDTKDSAPTSSSMQEVFLLEPFLRVNLVTPGSPAETAVRNMFLMIALILMIFSIFLFYILSIMFK